MDPGLAEEQLRAMVAADSVPCLDDGQIWMLVQIAADSDLNAAAAEGWRWKAAAVAGEYGFSVDGQRFDRDQMHAMCLAMVDHYARRRFGTVRTRGPVAAAAENVPPC